MKHRTAPTASRGVSVRRLQTASITAATAIAAFSFTLAPVLRFWALPRVQVAPLDIDSYDVSVGNGTYLDPATGKDTGPARITITRHVLGDVAEAKSTGYAVWDIATRTDTPATLPNPDARQAFSFSVDHWAFDRHTNQPQACCGFSPTVDGDAYMKFPFDLGKHDYVVWDATAMEAYIAHFDGTQKVNGHTLYRFVGAVQPVKVGTISVPGTVVGFSTSYTVAADEYYANPREVTLVDPITGAPVEGTSHLHVTLRPPGGAVDAVTALDVDVASDAATVAATSKRAADDDSRLDLVSTTLPLASLALGALASLAGAGIAVSARRRTRRPDPLPDPVERLATP
jgi:hypothetical protein